LEWPKEIGPEDLELVEIWVEAMKKKIKTSIGEQRSANK
jgi:hypothetical protein